MIRKLALILALVLALPAIAHAVEPDEVLSDPTQEARAREVGKGLRCVVCQNQSIDDSHSELARDMRILVRERIKAGDSNQDVMDYMVDRYGDFVLLDPPFKAETLVLWIGPGVIAVLGMFGLVMMFRRRTTTRGAQEVVSGVRAEPLSDAERRRLDELLKD